MSVRRLVLLSAVLVLCVDSASAGIIVSLDMDPGTANIQSHREVVLGEEFAVDVVFTLTGDTSLAAYGFGVRFDTEELDFISRTETPPSPLGELDRTNPFVDNLGPPYEPLLGDVRYGWLKRFDGVSLFEDGPVGPATLKVATLRFKAVLLQGDGSNIDMIAGRFEGFDGFGDNSNVALAPTFQGGSLTVVPEPSSLVLLGIAAVCVGGWHFRRRRKP